MLSDEIYDHLVYDGLKHTSLASLSPEIYDQTITINGFSKSHSMTGHSTLYAFNRLSFSALHHAVGYRIGYSASPLAIAKACGKLQSQLTSCASSVGQYAAMCALTQVPSSWITERLKELGMTTSFPCPCIFMSS